MSSSTRIARALLPIAAALAAFTALAVVAIDQPVARYQATIAPPALWKDGLALIDRATGLTWWKWLPTVIIVAGALVALALPPLRRAARGLGLVAASACSSRCPSSTRCSCPAADRCARRRR